MESGDGYPSFDDPIEIPIESVLDLHPFSPRDIKSVVEEYLEAARARGLFELRIIHGRGIGAQRELVRQILSATSFVLHFGDAPLEVGGWGATIVTLSRP